MTITDNEILAKIKLPEEKEEGFRVLMSTYKKQLYYHIRRYVSNHEDANDILQNTFLKVWVSIEQFRGDSSLYSWLYRIASNESITYINKTKKRNEIGLETQSIGEKGTADSLDSNDLIERLEKAIEILPDKQKQVFILRYYDEMPYEKMSEVLETSIGALKASYFHAVKKVEQFVLTV
ncbi:MAG: RNA polymerase sigma factor [Bacteroidetes bacterium]|nr:RNA polymerase sigma factor [Bacteroidota bacterium]MBK9633814.1 RNA polymerase sigma factor [Bacteroidota bacterium]